MDWNKTVKVAAVLWMALLPSWGEASSGGPPLPAQDWGFQGMFGQFDQASLKRGAKIAVDVCLGCHSIKYIKFDQLHEIGLSEVEIKALAESQGKTKKDKLLSAMEPGPAKEAFGIIPPDLSLMTKARKGFEDYVHGIITGYLTDEETSLVTKAMAAGPKLSETAVAEITSALHLDPHHPEKVPEIAARIVKGDNFNKYFPGYFLSMPKPLNAGQVKFEDGSDSSLNQMSKDVTTFLAWAAEPTQMERKSVGVKVILYLLILTVMLYALKRRIWAKVH